ncbi:MAG TPA: formylmethanofuran dehydrogenase [Methylotenera sp.]|nr:formylmethanofuran dehydrogenase [Methylotenera sp.]
MKITANPSQHSSQAIMATCPACGLLCDNIVINSQHPVKVIDSKQSCPKSIAFFEQALETTTPSLAGKPTDLKTAIKAVADILDKSNQPLFAGLGTEVQGMRALMRLAEKTGATLDHMHSETTVRNTLALQNGGGQTTTLTEIKNRADVILVIGTDIATSHPRFFDKLVWNSDSLFDKPSPEVIYLDVAEEKTTAGISPAGKRPTVVNADIANLPEIINALNALANGKKLHTDQVAGVAVASLNNILESLKAAQYAVIVWSASSLKFTHAELAIQSITRLIVKLNETNRVAGLPLNTGDGDTSVNYTSTWLSGYPTRNRFSNGNPEYDNYQFSSKQQLKNCDALLWVSTFNAYQPPQADIPTIVIGHPNMQFDVAPDVFIPVGIPGLDHTGTMFRMDGSVVLPLKKIRNADLPSLSQVIHQIEALLA